ncbi:hypothetical protein DW103_08745 [Parabacteroides sp. AM08-6]|nr:hypothetical protein DW103_08745 [Parabacteroides sp. AM08-6]
MRLKNKTSEFDSVLDKIKNIDVFYYSRKDMENEKVYGGVSAQNILDYYPVFVTKNDAGEYGVDYSGLATCLAIKGIQELLERIENLEQKLSA